MPKNTRISSSSESPHSRPTIGLLTATLEESRENEVWAGVIDAAREAGDESHLPAGGLSRSILLT